MKKLRINVSDRYRYLIACSGGPDSMALLELARTAGLYVEVAHVNYHKRDTAKRDEDIVRNYCDRYSIAFHLLDVYEEDIKGNFQAEARRLRYDFFCRLQEERNLDYVLVAHHLDDHLETYLMQKEKKVGTLTYGLSRRNVVYNAKIIRPLLDYDKKTLMAYAEENDVPYGIDESNLGNVYARNRIRHSVIEKMDDKDKQKLKKEISELNRELQSKKRQVYADMKKDGKRHDVSFFVEHPYIRTYLHSLYSGMSEHHLDEMLRQLKESKHYRYEKDGIIIVKEYGYISIFKKPESYRYVFNEIEYGSYGYFRMSRKGTSFEGVSLSKDDFPIVVRNVEEGDSIMMKYGRKKLNRYFIDNKIGLEDRMKWPVVANRNDDIVLMPGIGCDIGHYSIKHNLFVLKL